MILVTGGGGFVGSHLVEHLLARNLPVRALLRRSGGFENTSVDVVRGDLLRAEGLRAALEGVDTVIHIAGVTKALATADYYAGNVTATENLARAIASAGREIRTVHVSSLAAIGPSLDGVPVAEDAEPHPLTNYGKSKLEGERAMRRILPDAVVVRPPVVYGPRDTDVFEMLRSINKGIMTPIAGGERWFSAIYVKDLAEGLHAAAIARGAEGRTYALAHRTAVSWSELGAIAATIMNRKPRVVTIPVPVARMAGLGGELWSQVTRKPGIISREKIAEALCQYWTCETGRAKAELGFEAKTPLAEGLAATLSWYREAGWLKY